MSLLWTTDGFANSGPPPTTFHSYDNDSGVWTAYSGWPDAVIGTLNTGQRQQGGWDGTYWYLIGTDGKLYRMLGSTRVWSAALAGGAAFFASADSNNHHWQMAADGKFVYLLFDGNDFRRYDPGADTLTALIAPPNGSPPAGARSFLAYDGVDTLYCNGPTGTIRQYGIGAATWSTPATAAITGSDAWAAAVFLQGALWYFSDDAGGGLHVSVWRYDPTGNSWAAKTASGAISNLPGCTPVAEDTDGTIRIWRSTDSLVYNVGTDAWASGAAPAVDLTGRQGANWAVARTFAPRYIFFAADGVTPLPADDALGTLVIGQTLSLLIKVQAVAAVPGGAVVAVVPSVETDAAQVVTVASTLSGTYTPGFTTAALTIGQLFSVFIRVAPSLAQTSGLTKPWKLRVT